MSFVPKVMPMSEGKVELASAIKLPNGKFIRDGIKLDAENLGWFAECLEQHLRLSNSEIVHERGDDAVQFSFGGTDWEPRLLIFNYGANGGSVSLCYEEAPKLASAARDAAARGMGRR